jgi:hypothetical protein
VPEHSDYYVYVIFRPNGEPCYVGKGRGQRVNRHARGDSHNSHLARLYAKHGELPIWKAQAGLTNGEAIKTEKALIAALGRADKGIGPLVNFTDGGEGMAGHIQSPESIEKRASKRRGIPQPAEAIAKRTAKRIGMKRSPEAIAKTAAANKGQKRTPEQVARFSEAQKGRVMSERTRRALSISLTGRKWSPESIAKRSATVRAKHAALKVTNAVSR